MPKVKAEIEMRGRLVVDVFSMRGLPRAILTAAVTVIVLQAAKVQAEPIAEQTSDLGSQIAEYRVKLAEYKKARDEYETEAAPYWASVAEKRSRRLKRVVRGEPTALGDYVVAQPPLFSGPPKPKDPEKRKSDDDDIPVVADFLANAKEHFGFVPDRPASEDEYRRAYARAAHSAGLTAEQCVKIYAFESGGDGGYAVQAGLEYDRPGARAITTALGYNQLLTTNSIEMLAEAGDGFLANLNGKVQSAHGDRRRRLEDKIVTLKRMIAFSRSVPDRWADHTRLAGTAKGLAIHALILDIDISPLLQAQKLLTSVEFAKRRGYAKALTAAELEMMNLTGDGNGFDMVAMPDEMREKVPTSNFFQRGGYERNPVAIRNNTVAKLIAATDAKMQTEAELPGAKALAAAFEDVR